MSGLDGLILSDSFVALLTSVVLKASLLLLVALLLDVTLRRHTAALRHSVWTGTFAAVMLVTLAAPLAPNWSLPLLPERLAPSAKPNDGRVNPPTHVLQPSSQRRFAQATLATSAPDADATARRSVATPWATLVIAVWSVGTILLLAKLGAAATCASQLCRRAQQLDHRTWNDLLERTCQHLDVRAPVCLARSDAVHVPMAWGIRRHHIVLPSDAEGWSNDRREVVLLHELAHIRRADCLAHLLSGAVVALHWPNPLVWIARRRQRLERELACDDTVLASGPCGADYAWHLLEIARASDRRPELSAAEVTMATRSQLESRLLAALDASRDRSRLSQLGAAVPTVIGLLAAVALAGLQPWTTPAAQESQFTGQVSATAQPQQESATNRSPARQRAMQIFVALLNDPDVSIRRQAVHALGQMEAAAAVAALSETIADDDAGVREQVAWALGVIESADAVPSLATTIKHDADPSVREKAAWALGMIKHEAALDALIDAVGDDNAAVRKRALWAISRIAG